MHSSYIAERAFYLFFLLFPVGSFIRRLVSNADFIIIILRNREIKKLEN